MRIKGTERRRQILEMAEKLFGQKGYKQTSLEEIAEALNITKPALYLYFKSKEALFMEIIKKRFKELNESLSFISENKHLTPIEKFEKFIYIYVSFISDNLSFFSIMHKSEPSIKPFFKSKIHKSNMKKIFETIFNKTKEVVSTILKYFSSTAYDTEFLSIQLLSSIDSQIAYRHFIKKEKINKNVLTKKIFNFFINSLKGERV